MVVTRDGSKGIGQMWFKVQTSIMRQIKSTDRTYSMVNETIEHYNQQTYKETRIITTTQNKYSYIV